MHVLTSIKRSPPMTVAEAQHLSKQTSLFGYTPDVINLDGYAHLMIRGDGADDLMIVDALAAIRKNAGPVLIVDSLGVYPSSLDQAVLEQAAYYHRKIGS